jgi:hypothetical protein
MFHTTTRCANLHKIRLFILLNEYILITYNDFQYVIGGSKEDTYGWFNPFVFMIRIDVLSLVGRR